jgi:hypothetical protein
MGFSAIPTAGLGFFFSAWLTMIFWGTVAPDFAVLWLIVAPLAAAASKKGK